MNHARKLLNLELLFFLNCLLFFQCIGFVLHAGLCGCIFLVPCLIFMYRSFIQQDRGKNIYSQKQKTQPVKLKILTESYGNTQHINVTFTATSRRTACESSSPLCSIIKNPLLLCWGSHHFEKIWMEVQAQAH